MQQCGSLRNSMPQTAACIAEPNSLHCMFPRHISKHKPRYEVVFLPCSVGKTRQQTRHTAQSILTSSARHFNRKGWCTHFTVTSQQSSAVSLRRFLCLALSCLMVNLLMAGQLQGLVSQWLYKSKYTVRHVCNLRSTADEARFRPLRWQGHVARMPDNRQPVQMVIGQLLGPGVKGPP